MRSSHPSSKRRMSLSAAAVLALASSGGAFQPHGHRVGRRPSPSPANANAPRALCMASTSFQQARLAEQLRLSNQQSHSEEASTDVSAPEEPPTAGIGEDAASSIDTSEEARTILELETSALGSDGMPFAPMMTYQKYLTMQEKRVKVTVRYSAEAGLRPFYLTVANQIKATHPDVLLEKRILPPVGSDAGGEEAVFEVVVDGKTVIGKKKTKMLKVSSRTTRTSGGDDDKGEDGKGEGSTAKSGSGDAAAPDIAGGRSVFVSMEKLEHELTKARKKRRPNTMYKSKEDALRGAMASDRSGDMALAAQAGKEGSQSGGNTVQSVGMTEAVMRLERLKAMSTRSK